MNRLPAVVTAIARHGKITIVSLDLYGMPMHLMGLELNLPLHEGTQVILGVKATHVAVGKALEGELSFSNRLDAEVVAVETGELLCSVTLKIGASRVESIFTRESCERMRLHEGERATVLIKASDLSILEVTEPLKEV